MGLRNGNSGIFCALVVCAVAVSAEFCAQLNTGSNFESGWLSSVMLLMSHSVLVIPKRRGVYWNLQWLCICNSAKSRMFYQDNDTDPV